MNQYNTLNVKFSNSQLKKLNLEKQNYPEVTLKLSSTVVNDSNKKINFLHRLLLTNRQVFRFCKDFVNGSSVNIILSKIQLYRIGKPGGFQVDFQDHY